MRDFVGRHLALIILIPLHSHDSLHCTMAAASSSMGQDAPAARQGLDTLAATQGSVTVAVYNCGASTAVSFQSKEKKHKFNRTIGHDVRVFQNVGASIVFIQELHPDIPIDKPIGWVETITAPNLRTWVRDSQIEILASTQEQVLPTSDAQSWRLWHKLWLRVRSTGQVILCGNAHTVDGKDERKIPGDKKDRPKFKKRNLQAFLQQLVKSCKAPPFSCVPRSSQLILAGDFNMWNDAMRAALSSVVVDADDVKLSATGRDTMWGHEPLHYD